ncbi:hypothetical protein ABIC89_001038 [Variovorax boronicumulans]|uniref:hypothetical protein n=1 Tax=Variovorax boronicumulans TaxID=436515 RepID=UPI00339B8312
MAGEWLKFECSLPEKPETLAITIAMGWEDPDLTVGKLMRLFRWFDQQTVDGNAPSVSAALLDRIIGVSGFVQAVADVGWIVINGTSIHLANFDRHNGATAKSRALTAKRVANHKTNASANAEGNAASVSGALPREEKRREEDTVPNGTDGEAVKPASDLSKDELWKAGKSLLSQSGMPPAQCGSFVGKLVKDYGDQIVVEAVRTAVVSRPADPAEYLKATCMHAAGQRSVPEPAWRTEQRARTHQAAPGVAAGVPADQFFIDMEATDVSPRRLG